MALMKFVNLNIKGIYMSIFDNFFKKDITGKQTLNKDRKKIKIKFEKQLKEKLFMSETEIKSIISLIEDYEEKVDKIKSEFDFNNFSNEKWLKCIQKMYLLEEEMKNDVEGLIKYIMKKKLEIAKKTFGNQ